MRNFELKTADIYVVMVAGILHQRFVCGLHAAAVQEELQELLRALLK